MNNLFIENNGQLRVFIEGCYGRGRTGNTRNMKQFTINDDPHLFTILETAIEEIKRYGDKKDIILAELVNIYNVGRTSK